MTLHKPGVSAELVQTRSVLQAGLQLHNLKTPYFSQQELFQKNRSLSMTRALIRHYFHRLYFISTGRTEQQGQVSD